MLFINDILAYYKQFSIKNYGHICLDFVYICIHFFNHNNLFWFFKISINCTKSNETVKMEIILVLV